MNDIFMSVKRSKRLKFRSHQSRGYRHDGHTLSDVIGETNLTTPYEAGNLATQDSHPVNTSKVQPASGSFGGQCADKGEIESIKEENGATEPSGTPVSARNRLTYVERNNLTTSTHTEKSDSPLVNELSKELVDQLSHAMEKSAFKEKRLYIPDGVLDSLICRSTVRKELRSAYDENRQPWRKLLDARETFQLASLICPRRGLQFMSTPLALGPQKLRRLEYRKIFAILLLVGKAKEIHTFIKHKVSDEELPLVSLKVSDEEGLSFAAQSRPDSGLPCFESWNATAIHEFEQKQWLVLAPVFKDPGNEGIFHKDLNVASVLPFFEWTCCAKGRTACVYKTTIHPNHHTFSRNRNHGDVFAVKQLLDSRDVESSKADLPYEINVLEGILKPQHQHNHLINILATFRIEGRDYIILPWAQLDLLNYWRENRFPSPSRRTVKWLLEQCHGLACALRNIHRWPTYTDSKLYNTGAYGGNDSGENEPLMLFGRHGDIKPMNILWLDNGGLGTLKLADFGTARFFDAKGAPALCNLDAPTTPNYRAPESGPKAMVTPSWDIWALGCVYLEFVTWLCYGWTGVDTFAIERLAQDPHNPFQRTTTFYELGKHDASPKLKPAVHKHLDKLTNDLPYPKVLKLFLNYIMEKMVIVEDQAAKRSNATEVVQRTEEVLDTFARVTKRESRMRSLGEFHFLWID